MKSTLGCMKCCLLFSPNELSFPVKSQMCFKSFCRSGQNMLRKFTIPAKCLQSLIVVGHFNLCITSSLLCTGLKQTLFSLLKMVLPIYCNSFLNIFRPFLSNALTNLLVLTCEIPLRLWITLDHPWLIHSTFYSLHN